MDIAELRADILQLREKYQPLELEKERKANEVYDLAAHASLTRQRSTMIGGKVAKQGVISFRTVQYPCYCISLKALRQFDRLPVHEDALRMDILEVLTQSSTMPGSAFTYFISQVRLDRITTATHFLSDRCVAPCWCAELGDVRRRASPR
jgi:hypothetical protein